MTELDMKKIYRRRLIYLLEFIFDITNYAFLLCSFLSTRKRKGVEV
jgi:hypothetical protein